jgi:pyridinium-3,5-bisthiocarboxylic acid mononucleotide nickel chelatase
MRIAYLDCFSGVSGDMFLGALLDAGVSPQLLEQTVAALDIGARIEIAKVVRSGIAASKVDVFSHGEKDLPREVYWEQRVEHEHHAAHGHGDHHGHGLPAGTPTLHGRGLSEIRAIVQKAKIGDRAKETALAIFSALGEAEAKIHSTPVEQVHFHEVGAVDAMVDIVCAAVGAEALGVDEWICSPLNVGGGTVKCAHGTLPVPAPATVELLRGAPVYSSGLNVELVTPTGAAIVKTLVTRFASFPEMKIEQSGYGAGTREFPEQPNLLRLTIGESDSELASQTSQDTITVLEANLDDLSPQVMGYALERLLEEGALDAFAMPVQMKKSRPGTLLTVLAMPQDAARLTQLIFQETSTLGVRRREERRQTLARRFENVQTEWGEVRVKIASMNGTITNYAPEYEDCRRIAALHHVPLKEVILAATREYQRRGKA